MWSRDRWIFFEAAATFWGHQQPKSFYPRANFPLDIALGSTAALCKWDQGIKNRAFQPCKTKWEKKLKASYRFLRIATSAPGCQSKPRPLLLLLQRCTFCISIFFSPFSPGDRTSAPALILNSIGKQWEGEGEKAKNFSFLICFLLQSMRHFLRSDCARPAGFVLKESKRLWILSSTMIPLAKNNIPPFEGSVAAAVICQCLSGGRTRKCFGKEKGGGREKVVPGSPSPSHIYLSIWNA